MTARMVPTTNDTLRRLSRARHACKDLIKGLDAPGHSYMHDAVLVDRATGAPSPVGTKGRWEVSS